MRSDVDFCTCGIRNFEDFQVSDFQIRSVQPVPWTIKQKCQIPFSLSSLKCPCFCMLMISNQEIRFTMKVMVSRQESPILNHGYTLSYQRGFYKMVAPWPQLSCRVGSVTTESKSLSDESNMRFSGEISNVYWWPRKGQCWKQVKITESRT